IANFDEKLKARVVSADLRTRTCLASRAEEHVRSYLMGDAAALPDLIHQLIRTDIKTWLVDDILAKVDKMSMAASVEARVPFLDHELVEFMTALPVSVKVRTLGTKRLLRHAMRTLLPQHTLRRRKQAFSVPLDEWLRTPLRDFVGDVLLSKTTRERGWFDSAGVEALFQDHVTGAANYG